MRTLGRLFTFVLRIRPDHKIVRSGPYGIVRHPSYTGLYMEFFGFLLLIQSGATVAHFLSRASLKPYFVAPWIVSALLTYLFLHGYFGERMKQEERMLATEFGNDWDTYTGDVPYRLFPYVW